MSSGSSPPKEGMPSYGHPGSAHSPYIWREDAFYSQTSTHPSGHQSYFVHPGQMMEPAHSNLEYHTPSAHSGQFQSHPSLPYPSDGHGSHTPDGTYQYGPSSPGVSRTPMFGTPPTPPSHFPSAPARRLSPASSPSRPRLEQNIPEDVRDALNAAMQSAEFARGENVPAEILMPTVQKMDRDLWQCRICHKPHKRRDHTLTHVRTAHLDNKGFRCTFLGCDSAFGRKGDLERHVASTHQDPEPADSVCNRCHSQLHRKDNLLRHLKSCRGPSSSYRGGPSTGTSRSSRRGESSMAYSSAPYQMPSSRSTRHNSSVTTQSRPNPPQYQTTPFHAPPDPFYNPAGLGLIDVASPQMSQLWPSVLAPYDYSSYDLGISTMIHPSWV